MHSPERREVGKAGRYSADQGVVSHEKVLQAGLLAERAGDAAGLQQGNSTTSESDVCYKQRSQPGGWQRQPLTSWLSSMYSWRRVVIAPRHDGIVPVSCDVEMYRFLSGTRVHRVYQSRS